MVGIDAPQRQGDLLDAGYAALARGAWQESRDCFQMAVEIEETAEALEGLAIAAWWLDDATVVFARHERAYQLYRQRDDRLGAARMATWLGLDHYIFRGDLAITNGWLRRAHRLLQGIEPSAEHGWLAVWEAHLAFFEHNDISTAKKVCAETFALAQSLGLPDLEMLALALEGLALVSEGQVGEGMRRLDESTTAALGGEMSDPDAIATTCCYLIYACERIRDFDRAAQWCMKAEEVARRWSYRSIFAFCRSHYAAVLIWRGEWPQAEAELTMATRELLATRPGWTDEGIVRLAELRWRQGRLDEATALFAQASAHPRALLGQAELALERGDAVAAGDLVDRFLRRVPPEDRTERAAGLELAVRTRVALGAGDDAREALAELEAATHMVGTPPLEGVACFARGVVSAAAGELDAARRSFEDAVDLFRREGAPFETALARLELAGALAALGRRDAAAGEARLALDRLRKIGAERKVARAAALLRQLEAHGHTRPNQSGAVADLTPRELEILRLVAQGLTNKEIATRLFLSEHTIHRHLANILTKLDLPSRAAAAAYAAQHDLL